MYKKQGLLTLGGGAGIWGAEEDFLQLSGVSGGVEQLASLRGRGTICQL